MFREAVDAWRRGGVAASTADSDAGDVNAQEVGALPEAAGGGVRSERFLSALRQAARLMSQHAVVGSDSTRPRGVDSGLYFSSLTALC